jgi:hypothetical protein
MSRKLSRSSLVVMRGNRTGSAITLSSLSLPFHCSADFGFKGIFIASQNLYRYSFILLLGDCCGFQLSLPRRKTDGAYWLACSGVRKCVCGSRWSDARRDRWSCIQRRTLCRANAFRRDATRASQPDRCGAHLGIEKDHRGIRPPWTAQITFAGHAGIGDELAMIEDEAGVLGSG